MQTKNTVVMAGNYFSTILYDGREWNNEAILSCRFSPLTAIFLFWIFVKEIRKPLISSTVSFFLCFAFCLPHKAWKFCLENAIDGTGDVVCV